MDSEYVQLDLWNSIEFFTDDAFTEYPNGSDYSADESLDPGLDSFKIGLFGHDMTDFFEDCTVAYYCDM